MNILMIGCGKMGGAMLEQWAQAGQDQVTVVDPADIEVPEGVTHVGGADALGGLTFDAVIIAMKPQLIPSVLGQYRDFRAPEGVFVSVAAGFSLQKLTLLLGNQPVVRAMPNLPAVIGEGVTGLYANKLCSEDHKANVSRLMDATGLSLWVDSEDQLDRLTAISGSGPGFVFQLIESYVAAAESLGFPPKVARDLVTRTITGATSMAATSGDSIEDLRASVTSKNGTTEAGLSVMRHDGVLDKLFGATTAAAYRRAVELR